MPREFYVSEAKEKVYRHGGWDALWVWAVRQRIGGMTRRVCVHDTRAEARRCARGRNGHAPYEPCEVER